MKLFRKRKLLREATGILRDLLKIIDDIPGFMRNNEVIVKLRSLKQRIYDLFKKMGVRP